MLESFDTVSIFASVPIEYVLLATEPLQALDLYKPSLACLRSTNFCWDEQQLGATTGSCLFLDKASIYSKNTWTHQSLNQLISICISMFPWDSGLAFLV